MTDGGQLFSGTVEESSGSTLSFPVAGTVERICVEAGQRVAKGELIAELDESTPRDTHDAAVATLEQAEDAWRRMKQLHEAIFLSAKRRMRPIFLTSAAASMGVIPMILGGSGLWMPMGTVIFYGTLITMLFILTVIPVAYWKVMAGSAERRIAREKMERQ